MIPMSLKTAALVILAQSVIRVRGNYFRQTGYIMLPDRVNSLEIKIF
jgi:hypothetical protein